MPAFCLSALRVTEHATGERGHECFRNENMILHVGSGMCVIHVFIGTNLSP